MGGGERSGARGVRHLEPLVAELLPEPVGRRREARRALGETYTLFPVTLSDSERLHIRATVVLYIDGDGRLIRYAFENRSGNPAFDAALERAIRAARLPPPPAELRRKYRTEGLGVLYKP